jgi:hypothetical protein
LKIPAVRIHEIHAIAVPADNTLPIAGRNAFDEVSLQVRNASDRNDTLHALVGGTDPPARGAAA